jgi:hypothetical protein
VDTEEMFLRMFSDFRRDRCRATIKVRQPVNQDERVSAAWAEGRA